MNCFSVNSFIKSRPVQIVSTGGVALTLALAVIGALAITSVIPGVSLGVGIGMTGLGGVGAIISLFFLFGNLLFAKVDAPISPDVNLYVCLTRYESEEHDTMQGVLQQMDKVEDQGGIGVSCQILIRGPCAFRTKERMCILGLQEKKEMQWYSLSQSGTSMTQIKKIQKQCAGLKEMSKGVKIGISWLWVMQHLLKIVCGVIGSLMIKRVKNLNVRFILI